MTEGQIAALVLRYREQTGASPEALIAHPATILRLVLEHCIQANEYDAAEPTPRIMGVPVLPDPHARRGILYIGRRASLAPWLPHPVEHVRPPGIPCS